MTVPELEGAYRYLMLREAIATVAIQHREACECDTCLAAYGDKEAFLRVWLIAEHERSEPVDADDLG
jgi:hypothetical protein